MLKGVHKPSCVCKWFFCVMDRDARPAELLDIFCNQVVRRCQSYAPSMLSRRTPKITRLRPVISMLQNSRPATRVHIIVIRSLPLLHRNGFRPTRFPTARCATGSVTNLCDQRQRALPSVCHRGELQRHRPIHAKRMSNRVYLDRDKSLSCHSNRMPQVADYPDIFRFRTWVER
jgi:hypothetical protein